MNADNDFSNIPKRNNDIRILCYKIPVIESQRYNYISMKYSIIKYLNGHLCFDIRDLLFNKDAAHDMMIKTCKKCGKYKNYIFKQEVKI